MGEILQPGREPVGKEHMVTLPPFGMSRLDAAAVGSLKAYLECNRILGNKQIGSEEEIKRNDAVHSRITHALSRENKKQILDSVATLPELDRVMLHGVITDLRAGGQNNILAVTSNAATEKQAELITDREFYSKPIMNELLAATQR